MIEKLLLTVPETMGSLGIGRSTIFTLFKNGTIPTVKIGSRRFVRATDLAKYVESL